MIVLDCFFLILLPFLFLKALWQGKVALFCQKFKTFHLPKVDRETIWIHAVSVGEVKAARAIMPLLKEEYKDAYFLVTTTTETGLEEAKRSLTQADFYFLLPFDLSWIQKRWVRNFRVKLLIFVESDIWPNLVYAAKKSGAKVVLVSGKLSQKSAKRWRKGAYFARKLFSKLDLLFVQSEEHFERFYPLVHDKAKVVVGGNLKMDLEPDPVDVPPSLVSLSASLWITLGCTHPREEKAILEELFSLENAIFFVAPRHLSRIEELKQLFREKEIVFALLSELSSLRGDEKVILVDQMGKLSICYKLSQLAIMGGSFFEGVGGHNVLEPTLYGAYALFGPYMEGQKELVQEVLYRGAGKEALLCELKNEVLSWQFKKKQKGAKGKARDKASHVLIDLLKRIV